MNFRRIDLEEYLSRLSEEDIKDGLDKAYLPECLKNNTAEFYLINDKDEFWYFIDNDTVELCICEKDVDSIFDNKQAMESILDFIKNKGYKKIIISLSINKFPERHTLASDYGFSESTDRTAKEFKYYEKTYN